MFKTDDKVKITSVRPSWVYWNDLMTAWLGFEGVVQKTMLDDREPRVQVWNEERQCSWYFPLDCLTLLDGGEVPEKAPVTAPQFLAKAQALMVERGKQYDKPEGERSMGTTVQAFNLITSHTLTEAEGWLLLQLLKDVRQWQKEEYHADSAEDCIAYAALKAEALQGGK